MFPRPSSLSVTKGIAGQQVTVCSRPLGSQNITIYCVPAPLAPKVSLFTVFPPPWLPKYHYLQCSRPLGSQSITIYSVPAPLAPKVSLFTVFPPLGSQSITIYSVPAPFQP